MKKWYLWFILSGIWALAALFNTLEKRSVFAIGYNLALVVLFAALGIAQRICDQKGERGKKIFHRICMVLTLLAVLAAVLIMVFA